MAIPLQSHVSQYGQIDPENIPLLSCEYCDRKFFPQSLDKHKVGCERDWMRHHCKQKDEKEVKKPPVAVMQLSGFKFNIKTMADMLSLGAERRKRWRLRHEEFLHVVQSARTSNSSTDQPIFIEPLSPTIALAGLIQCEFCGRRFNEAAIGKHTELCRESHNSAPADKTEAQKEAKTRFVNRMKYHRGLSNRNTENAPSEVSSEMNESSPCELNLDADARSSAEINPNSINITEELLQSDIFSKFIQQNLSTMLTTSFPDSLLQFSNCNKTAVSNVPINSSKEINAGCAQMNTSRTDRKRISSRSPADRALPCNMLSPSLKSLANKPKCGDSNKHSSPRKLNHCAKEHRKCKNSSDNIYESGTANNRNLSTCTDKTVSNNENTDFSIHNQGSYNKHHKDLSRRHDKPIKAKIDNYIQRGIEEKEHKNTSSNTSVKISHIDEASSVLETDLHSEVTKHRHKCSRKHMHSHNHQKHELVNMAHDNSKLVIPELHNDGDTVKSRNCSKKFQDKLERNIAQNATRPESPIFYQFNLGKQENNEISHCHDDKKKLDMQQSRDSPLMGSSADPQSYSQGLSSHTQYYSIGGHCKHQQHKSKTIVTNHGENHLFPEKHSQVDKLNNENSLQSLRIERTIQQKSDYTENLTNTCARNNLKIKSNNLDTNLAIVTIPNHDELNNLPSRKINKTCKHSLAKKTEEKDVRQEKKNSENSLSIYTFCSNCGERHSSEARFCAKCGTSRRIRESKKDSGSRTVMNSQKMAIAGEMR